MVAEQQIVAFDLDGTLISGQTQQMLVHYLAKRRELPPNTVVAVGVWFLRYRLGLPVDHEKIRLRVLTALAGYSLKDVQDIVDAVFVNYIEPRVRQIGLKTIQAYESTGVRTVIVSASAEPIVSKVALEMGATGGIGTRLENDGQWYTGRIDGAVLHGKHKLNAIEIWANQRYKQWTLKAAYGDHESDADLLDGAQDAYAVCPSRALRDHARTMGWSILTW